MICIDSDVIIDFLKGKKRATDLIQRYKDQISTTEINLFEVFYGIYINKIGKREEESAQSFFDTIAILSLDGWGKKAASIFAQLIEQGKRIEQNDCLIAGIMLVNNCYNIITKNEAHFSRIKDIKIIPY